MSVISGPVQRDPYQTLGVGHDATHSQIKVAYRRLALKFHPDRQIKGTQEKSSSDEEHLKSTVDKFAEASAAYALLSDPIKKRQYDHLYKFGAYDQLHQNNKERVQFRSCAKFTNYKYTEDFSGGYYTSVDRATPPSPSIFRSQSSSSHDSFFDDLIYSQGRSRNNNVHSGSAHASSTSQCANGLEENLRDQPGLCRSNSNDEFKRKPGIGFRIPPLGKNLSIYVPSRNEIVIGLTRGERLHNLGTRITFSSQEVEFNRMNGLKVPVCSGIESTLSSNQTSDFSKENGNYCCKKVVSTTTRIARGKHRVVRKTAYLHADGKKEVVVEENGMVMRRYVEDCSNNVGHPASPRATQQMPQQKPNRGSPTLNVEKELQDRSNVLPFISNKNTTVQEENENGRPWYFDILKGMQGVIRPCLAPCAPVLVSGQEKDA